MEATQKRESYQELKARHQREFSEFPIRFAFSLEQLNEALADLEAEKDDCCSIPGGGIIRKKDQALFAELVKRHDKEYVEAFENNTTLIEAIVYELANHEYGYTYDPTDTINCLGLDLNDERTKACFKAAKEQYLAANEF